ncbi:type I DNA topoisomerase [Sphingoaurantiacus capsulatus]|uniref:DNA topoisomerase 1 n=1 Tax=Sphingoaurantiacus capsulatus TaxID=1771310 RepID=A0ABV7X6V3_9SPHN
MQLVIVESPAKAKTINKYLGSDYKVLASYGHVRDLPPKDGSVLPDDDFRMLWEVSADRSKQLRAISDEAKSADTLILATDPDREGEAISWHLYEWLKGKRALPKDVQRVTFNEITKGAILTAMKAPRQLDQELVDAYLARRALDYLVGFTLSPVLWRKLPGAKSAGRVQSVALRLIVDREREIETFITREFWTVDGDFASPGGQAFGARLVTWQGKKLDKFDLNNAALANEAKADVLAGRYKVAGVETKPVSRNPYPPFTTSTLQQEAARKLGFTATQTMRVAQQLYEEGVITYMRTDGVTIAGEAIAAARDVIGKRFGATSVPDKPRVYTSKAKNAQEAHEAIRPTEMSRAPDAAGLSGDHRRLYELVWKRTLASQMASARLERTSVDLVDEHGRATLRATGQVVLFPGFLALYQEDRDEPADEEDGQRLPKLTQGDMVKLDAARAEQHFTQPPPRYSEASLVKKLEELGIGRPSTYASILQTLRDRSYVRVDKNRFHPEEKGRLVTAFLERFFEKYVSYDFTAGLEEQLDEIADGDIDWKTVLREFWKDFQPKTQEIIELKPSEVTLQLDEFLAPYLFPDKGDGDPRRCPACGDGRLSLRGGKFGSFIACSNYPNCRYTRPFGEGEAAGANGDTGPKELGLDPESQEPITLRSGRFGLFVQRGESEKPPRASLPRDVKAEDLDLAMAVRLLSLPRTIGNHPETGLPITASIGRYGPYLAHDGKYAKLTSTAEVFETGMNAAVVKLAEPRGGKFERKAPAALREIGAHPTSGAAIRLMEGRFGPYVTDGTTNATVPKAHDIQTLSLEDAAALIDARAAAGPSKKGGRGKKAPAKAAAKKPAAKKPATKAKKPSKA